MGASISRGRGKRTALRAGVHPKIVSERLGHSSIQITLDIYSHVSEEQDREAATKVAELFRP